NGQGLCAHGPREGPDRIGGAVPPCAAQCVAPSVDAYRSVAPVCVSRFDRVRIVFQHFPPRHLRRRGHRLAGLCDRAHDGVAGIAAVRAGLSRVRHRLYVRRSARASELTYMPKFVFLWTDLVLWLLAAGSVFYVLKVRRDRNLLATWRRIARDAP